MSQVLSSDILEQQFGPTELEVLWQDERSRIICTKVASSGQVLEISYVDFDLGEVENFRDIHQKVVAGKSMGKAFRRAGIPFHRVVGAANAHDLPENLKRQFDSPSQATVVEISVMAGEEQVPYAKILEIYSPAVQWPRSAGRLTAEQLERIRMIDTFLSGSGALIGQQPVR